MTINLVTIETARTNTGRTAVVGRGRSGRTTLLGESAAQGAKRATMEVMRSKTAQAALERLRRNEAHNLDICAYVCERLGGGLSDTDVNAQGERIIEVEMKDGYRVWERLADWRAAYDEWWMENAR